MLDPDEQAKGGFRAQVARANELQTSREHAQDAAAAATDATPDAAQAADGQADGAASTAEPVPPARRPKRWR